MRSLAIPSVDKVIDHFYSNILGKYWDKERTYVDERYRTIHFPFEEIDSLTFTAVYKWTLEQMVGFLNSWSAVQHYVRQNNRNLLDIIMNDLKKHWDEHPIQKVTFSIFVKAGVKEQSPRRFGLAMAIVSLFGLTQKIEPFLWLVIFIIYAITIAKNVTAKHFLHGFLTSVANGIWISLIHASFFSTYMANNPDAQTMYQLLPQSIPPPVFMLIIAPIIGVATGLIAGLFALITAKFIKPKASEQQNLP